MIDPDFWTSVRELAAMRAQIPEERRAMSAIRMLLREKTKESKR